MWLVLFYIYEWCLPNWSTLISSIPVSSTPIWSTPVSSTPIWSTPFLHVSRDQSGMGMFSEQIGMAYTLTGMGMFSK